MSHTLTIEYGEDVLFSLGMTEDQFSDEARFLLAVKFYEIGRLSSGQAAKLCGKELIDFLLSLERLSVPVNNSRSEDAMAEEYVVDNNSASQTTRQLVTSDSISQNRQAEENANAHTISKLDQATMNISGVVADYKKPSSEMLAAPIPQSMLTQTELSDSAQVLIKKCAEFKASGKVKQITSGPLVTIFEFEPDPGVKYSRITGLANDLCLGLRVESINIDRIPGKSTVGIEVPNEKRQIIRLREIVECNEFRDATSKLVLALGKTVDGSNFITDLACMPHLLIAGATGTGKSVALNTILLSLLISATPEDVQFVLVDPKRLELGIYSDLPHLLKPIVTDPKHATYTLKWVVSEMESRYKYLATFGVRNIEQYNTGICAASDRNLTKEHTSLPKRLPYIVVIIDELADLMMVAAREVEKSVIRLAQMGRAAGIHLILATQRPSSDVITSQIKANMSARISFRVASRWDSRTILDAGGAENLLGHGDMLFRGPTTSQLVRVHGAYVDEKEVKRICDFIRVHCPPAYHKSITISDTEMENSEPVIVRNAN